MGLKVKLPIILEMDNRGAVDLANNWSIVGHTRHVNVRQFFLRELKESKVMDIHWIKGLENNACQEGSQGTQKGIPDFK